VGSATVAAFAVTYWTAIIDDSGASIGTARRTTGRVRDGRTTGSYTGVVFLGDQRATGSGTFRGVRIAAD
jgi:hypothetical protein